MCLTYCLVKSWPREKLDKSTRSWKNSYPQRLIESHTQTSTRIICLMITVTGIERDVESEEDDDRQSPQYRRKNFDDRRFDEDGDDYNTRSNRNSYGGRGRRSGGGYRQQKAEEYTDGYRKASPSRSNSRGKNFQQENRRNQVNSKNKGSPNIRIISELMETLLNRH